MVQASDIVNRGKQTGKTVEGTPSSVSHCNLAVLHPLETEMESYVNRCQPSEKLERNYRYGRTLSSLTMRFNLLLLLTLLITTRMMIMFNRYKNFLSLYAIQLFACCCNEDDDDNNA